MMNRARNDLFSASCLSRYQNRRIGFGDALGRRHEALKRRAMHNRRHALEDLRVGLSGQESDSFWETYGVRNKVLLKIGKM